MIDPTHLKHRNRDLARLAGEAFSIDTDNLSHAMKKKRAAACHVGSTNKPPS